MNSDERGETSKAPLSRVVSRGASILDLVLRVIAVVGTLASAIAMGTTDQTLPLFLTQLVLFKARYSDFPALTYVRKHLSAWLHYFQIICGYYMMLQRFEFYVSRFFVVANSIVSAYLILSLPLSIVHIIRTRAKFSRLILIFLDAVRLHLL